MCYKRIGKWIYAFFVSFLTLPVLGQQIISSTDFLATAYQSPTVELLQEKIKYQLFTDHTLPVIKEMEIRTEFNSFDWSEQEYTLRAEFTTKRQRNAQNAIHEASSTVNSLDQQVELKKAITNRYEWLVKWLETTAEIENKEALKSLYEDQLKVLRRMVGDIDFDVKDLIKAEEEVLEMAYDIIELQNSKERLKASLKTLTGADSIVIDKAMVVSNEQILEVLAMGNLDSTQHSELARREGRLDLLEREKEVELSEIKNPLKFTQLKINDYEPGVGVSEYVSVGFSLKLPFKGDKKLDLNELELEKIERLGEYEILKAELETEEVQLRNNIQQLFKQKEHLKSQQENSQAKYTLERLLELEEAKGLDILKLKEILLQREQRTNKLDFDILKTYIKWLDVSDKVLEMPRKNHLLAVPELLNDGRR